MPPETRYVDVTRWPIIVYTAPGSVSDEELAAVMAETRGLKALGTVHAVVLDVRNVEKLTPVQRRLITTRMADEEEITKKYTAAVALVFESALLRGLLTAIFWVKAAIAPTRVFGTPEEAIAWCATQIKERAPRAA